MTIVYNKVSWYFDIKSIYLFAQIINYFIYLMAIATFMTKKYILFGK